MIQSLVESNEYVLDLYYKLKNRQLSVKVVLLNVVDFFNIYSYRQAIELNCILGTRLLIIDDAVQNRTIILNLQLSELHQNQRIQFV